MGLPLTSGLQRPNPTALAFSQNRLPVAADRLVLDPVEGQNALPQDVSQVLIPHEDVLSLAQEPTPAVVAAGAALKPGGTLMVTTGTAALGKGDALEEQLREAGFKNFGLVVRERAYITAEKSIAQGVDELTPQQGNLLLARTQFAGQADVHQRVQQAGLEPKFTTSVRGRRIHFSKPFKSGDYNAHLGYVEADDGSLKARTFYQSKSQGIWRSASGLVGHSILGKGPEGRFESSTNLPGEMQRRLSEVSREIDPKTGPEEEMKALFHAPLEKIAVGHSSAFDRQIQERAFGQFELQVAVNKHQSVGKPESFHYQDDGHKPNLQGPKEAFQMEHPTRGKLDATTVVSGDQQFRYLFLQDSAKRTWLGMVESLGEVNDFGVPSVAVRDESLTHPAIEYIHQTPQAYRGEVVTWDRVHNQFTNEEEVLPGYVDATAYSHKLPPVREFLESQSGA